MKIPQNKQTIEALEESIREKEIVVYGMTNNAKEVCKNYKVKYIVDRNDELCDVLVEGIRIYDISRLYGENPADIVLVICTSSDYYREILLNLSEIGDFTFFLWDVIKSPFRNKISCDLFDSLPRINKIITRLNDDYSKKVLFEIVSRRICGLKTGYLDLKVQDEIQYIFWPALMSKADGIILDVGGFNGDSVDRMINQLGNNISDIYTFEALPKNVEKINIKKDKIRGYWDGKLTIFPYAVADKAGEITFYETESQDSCFVPDFRETTAIICPNPKDAITVNTVAIDDVISSNDNIRYIKMDIEGAEYQALVGAKQTIIKNRPGLAISIYHNPADYYRLAELILEYVPDYKLAVRHHKNLHVDTVLYAWI